MLEMNIHEAKTHFSKLIARVRAGETVVIKYAGEPVAKLVRLPTKPHPKRKKKRVLGLDEGTFKVPEDFNEMDEDLRRDFEDDDHPLVVP